MNCEQIIYKYPLPKNFDANNAEFEIFKNLAPENCYKMEVKFFKNIRISNNSVLFNYFNIIPESCVPSFNFEKYNKDYKFFLKFIFPKLNFSKKRFIFITDEWTSNYYHWHIFALKKLAIFKEHNLIENSLLFLPKKYQRYKFALPSLKKFGIKENQIVFLRRKSNIKTVETALAIAPQQSPAGFQEIREILLQNTEYKNLGFGDKIYISREGQALRFIENEKEVTALLEKYGFKKLIMEKFSYDEQINICRDAKYLVSPHGAGLTNILFMAKNTNILEMATKPNPIKPLTDYYKLATMLDINYFYQENEIRGEEGNFHQVSLVIDLAKLEKNLQLMLKND